jgi:PilZ domain
VAINLDGAEDRIDCYVKSVTGAVATLGRFGGLPLELRRALSPGLLGYLTFSFDGEPVALRGVATVDCAPEPDFAFVGLDGIKMPERRSDVRVNLATVARVCTIADDGHAIAEPIETVTLDLSLGGVLIERRQRMGIGPLVRVDLYFGADPTPVSCSGKVARLTITHMGVKFIEMQEADRVRLAGILSQHAKKTAA